MTLRGEGGGPAGLASCAMEGFDGARVAQALALPASFAVPAVVAVGLPQDAAAAARVQARAKEGGAHGEREEAARGEQLSPRFGLADSVFEDRFGEPLK